MVERRKQFVLEPEQTEPAAPHLREVAGAEHIPNVSLTLRMARQRAGHDLTDVARVLRIRSSNLEAIEAGRFESLPGPTYVTGFLRSYAEYLGLDRDEIMTRYREEIGASSRQKLSFPTASHEGRMPRGWLVFAALVLVVLAYAGWYYYTSQHKGAAVTVAEPPAATTATTDGAATAKPAEVMSTTPAESPSTAASSTPLAEPAPAALEVSGNASSDNNPPATTKIPTAPEPAGPASATLAPTAATPVSEDEGPEAPPEPINASQADAEPADPVSAAPATSPTNASASALEAGGSTQVALVTPSTHPAVVASGPSRVTITARVDSWLQIQGPGNELIESRILRSSESIAVPNRPGLQMVTGNAGGLEITVDGQPIASVGPMGVVRRNIVLDADSLRSTYGTASR
ncbi:MAG: helix-turn-helix domain-containing protein [Alphaproteobacteria bacterium]|nr:helix-turn-helix domain-containing protein [Alphaproteobacteria bacterium]